MLFARRAGALLLGAAMAVLPVLSHSAPEVGAYRWDAPAGPANIDEFSNWLGSAVTIASLFHGRNTWSEIEGQDSQLSAWSQWVRAQQGRNLSIAVGMFPPGGSLASCAAGSYDAHWRKLADNLAFHGLHWAYLRLGWQMETPGNAWAALPPGSGKEASYAGCFRRIVQTMRQEQPANQWKFVFNVTDTTWPNTTWLESVWPGDAYVDVVGVTVYDQSWIPDSYPYPSGCDAGCRLTRQQNAWNHRFWHLLTLRDFATAHGKPMAFPEWGLLVRSDGHGGGDNPYFVEKMHDFFMDPANNVVFHAYTNTSRQYDDSRLTDPTAQDYTGGPTQLPNGAARYKSLLGAQSSLGVAFTAPAAGATISGSFSGSTGCEVSGTGVANVVFFMDNTQLNTDNSAPWQCTLDTRNFANGTHTLRAVAYNSAGASTTVTRSVNVQNGPTGVTFTAPAAGATISGLLQRSNGCQVSGTGIVRVVFFMDNTQLNTDNSAPWRCTLDTRNFANGTHTLRAVAYDSAGASTTVTRSVNVQNVSGPTGVTFTAPAAGATISGSFSGSDGCQVTGTGIVRVVFFMDNTQLNTDNSAPWRCTLDTRNFANGTHTLRAVAYDSAGASTTVTRSVNVQNVSGPTGVTFTAPAAGATISGSFSASSGCQVSGTGIVRVVFFMDNTQLNTDNSAPWQCTLDTRSFANGTHTLRAVAYDSAGASTTVTRSVNVQNTSGPTGVTFTAPAAGATISGAFSASSGCQVSGTGIANVVFFMDNTQLNTDNSAPWQCTLDTRSFANGTHTLRAVAYDSAGASTTVTRAVNVQNTAPPPPPPPPPSNTATLAWDAVTHPDLGGYRVYFGTASGTYFQAAGNGVDVGNATTYTVTGLSSGTRYHFAVKAYSSNTESAFSNEVFKDIP